VILAFLERVLEGLGLGQGEYITLDCRDHAAASCDGCNGCDHDCGHLAEVARMKARVR
jgi:hypothetical protein